VAVETRPTEGMIEARQDMIEEARRIIDAGRTAGLVLRLFGGLAVRAHCELAYVCERDYSDIDMIGLRKQYKEIPALFAQLGYKENPHVRQATANRQLQFYRQCDHPDAELHYFIHPDDHVDVFLDAFRMDHEVPLSDRLEIEDYTISLSDVLLTKLQAAHMDEKDERDVVSLLSQSPLGETDERGAINAAYIARLCAGEWGLYYDVLAGVAHVREFLPGRDDLDPALAERVRSSLDRLEAAIEHEPKSTKWKLRARVGTRAQWRETVEEQEGEEHGPPIAPPGSPV
jgi:hypothetical protein